MDSMHSIIWRAIIKPAIKRTKSDRCPAVRNGARAESLLGMKVFPRTDVRREWTPVTKPWVVYVRESR